MNNHTVKSWRTFLGQHARDDVDATRKKMSIAYRKAKSAQADQQLQAGAEDVPASSQSSREPTLDPQLGDGSTQFQEDLEAISRFFATGGGDEGEEDDAHVWRRLTSQVGPIFHS